MVCDMSYATLSAAIDSWEAVKRIPNFDEKVGTQLFEKLFEMEPNTKALFGLKPGQNKEFDVDAMKQRRLFEMHATRFIRMVNQALELLGPDVELLTDILFDLGSKHVGYGVKPEYYACMGRALISIVKEMSDKEEFTEIVERAWFEVFGALSYDMIRAYRETKQTKGGSSSVIRDRSLLVKHSSSSIKA